LITGFELPASIVVNHDARLEQAENMISRLGTFGRKRAQKGTKRHFLNHLKKPIRR
jgi:hypothetical protein